MLAGFENHGGRTHLGPAASAARPRAASGHGNNGPDGREGVRGGAHGTVMGTYLHGPLLPKNAWFADWLAATALGLGPSELPPLDDALEDAAHAGARRAAVRVNRRVGRFPRPRPLRHIPNTAQSEGPSGIAE